jgi:DNA-binding NarL/FixJ family response regulator
MIRVALAEDSVLLRAGLERLLADADMEIVCAVDNAEQLLREVDRLREAGELDLVITDVRMPPTHTDEGLRAALVIRSRHPELPILVLSQYVEERYAADLLGGRTRGVGYLLKDRVADVEDFLAALRRVAEGGTALDPDVVAQLLARTRQRDPLGELTPREREVLGLMAEGRSNAAISRQLVISSGAVEKHVTSVFTKLGLEPDAEDHRRVLAVLRYLGGVQGSST